LKKRRNIREEYHYEILIRDWSPNVYFNEYAGHNFFNKEQYEENITLSLFGELSWSSSKKLKDNKHVCVVLFPSDFWYEEVKQGSLFEKEVEDDGSIGEIELIPEYRSCVDNKNLIMFRVSIPTKSYETILTYLAANRGFGSISILGSELFRKRGKIMCFSYKGEV